MTAPVTFRMATWAPIFITLLARGTSSAPKIGILSQLGEQIVARPSEGTPDAPARDRVEYHRLDKNGSSGYYVEVTGLSVNGSVHNQVFIIDKFVGELEESSEDSGEQTSDAADHSSETQTKPDASYDSTTTDVPSYVTHGTDIGLHDGEEASSNPAGYLDGVPKENQIEDTTPSIVQPYSTNSRKEQLNEYQPTTNNYHETTVDSSSSYPTMSTDAANGGVTDIEQETSQDTSNLFTAKPVMTTQIHGTSNTDLPESPSTSSYQDGYTNLTEGEQMGGYSSTSYESNDSNLTTIVIPAEKESSSYSDSMMPNTDPTSFGEQGTPEATVGSDESTKLAPVETPPSSNDHSSKTDNRTGERQNHVRNSTTQATDDAEEAIVLVPGGTSIPFRDTTPLNTDGVGDHLYTTGSPIDAQSSERTNEVQIYDDPSTTQVAVNFDRTTAPVVTSSFFSDLPTWIPDATNGGHKYYKEQDLDDSKGPSKLLPGHTSSTKGAGESQTAEQQLTTQSTGYSYETSTPVSGETPGYSTSSIPVHSTDRADEGPTYGEELTTGTSLDSHVTVSDSLEGTRSSDSASSSIENSEQSESDEYFSSSSSSWSDYYGSYDSSASSDSNDSSSDSDDSASTLEESGFTSEFDVTRDGLDKETLGPIHTTERADGRSTNGHQFTTETTREFDVTVSELLQETQSSTIHNASPLTANGGEPESDEKISNSSPGSEHDGSFDSSVRTDPDKSTSTSEESGFTSEFDVTHDGVNKEILGPIHTTEVTDKEPNYEQQVSTETSRDFAGTASVLLEGMPISTIHNASSSTGNPGQYALDEYISSSSPRNEHDDNFNSVVSTDSERAKSSQEGTGFKPQFNAKHDDEDKEILRSLSGSVDNTTEMQEPVDRNEIDPSLAVDKIIPSRTPTTIDTVLQLKEEPVHSNLQFPTSTPPVQNPPSALPDLTTDGNVLDLQGIASDVTNSTGLPTLQPTVTNGPILTIESADSKATLPPNLLAPFPEPIFPNEPIPSTAPVVPNALDINSDERTDPNPQHLPSIPVTDDSQSPIATSEANVSNESILTGDPAVSNVQLPVPSPSPVVSNTPGFSDARADSNVSSHLPSVLPIYPNAPVLSHEPITPNEPVLSETTAFPNPSILSGVQYTPNAPITYIPPHVLRPSQAFRPGMAYHPGNHPYARPLSPGRGYIPPWVHHSPPAYTKPQYDRGYFSQPYHPFWRTGQNNASEEGAHLER